MVRTRRMGPGNRPALGGPTQFLQAGLSAHDTVYDSHPSAGSKQDVWLRPIALAAYKAWSAFSNSDAAGVSLGGITVATPMLIVTTPAAFRSCGIRWSATA